VLPNILSAALDCLENPLQQEKDLQQNKILHTQAPPITFLLQKLTVAWQLKKFPTSYGT
jgi:hypothetical protein